MMQRKAFSARTLLVSASLAMMAIQPVWAESVSERGGEDHLFEIEQDETKVIDRHDLCREVTNLNEDHIMVPTGSAAEWYDSLHSIIVFEPQDVLFEPCEYPEPVDCHLDPEPGAECNDGSVFLGPDLNETAYVTTTSVEHQEETSFGSTIVTPTSRIDGPSNSAAAATENPDGAADYCENLEAHGHDDWYLPAIDELGKLRATDRPDGTYWSSTSSGVGIRIDGPHISTGTSGIGSVTESPTGQGETRCFRSFYPEFEDDSPEPCDLENPMPGTICKDGTVFSHDEGDRRLLTSDLDYEEVFDETIMTFPDNTNTTDGIANTQEMVSQGGYPFADYCNALDAHDRSDWFLPARGQMASSGDAFFSGPDDGDDPWYGAWIHGLSAYLPHNGVDDSINAGDANYWTSTSLSAISNMGINGGGGTAFGNDAGHLARCFVESDVPEDPWIPEDNEPPEEPTPPEPPADIDFTSGQLSIGRAGTCTVADGNAYCWGVNASPDADIRSTSQFQGMTIDGNIVMENSQGAYGDPVYDLTYQDIPGEVVSVTTSSYHSCALTDQGDAYCWGNNLEGQLGGGFTSGRETDPVEVVDLSDIVAIDMPSSEPVLHTCAVRDDGTVWCWGDGGLGRLGNGAQANSSTPVQVSGIDDAVDVSVGAYHACALHENGDVSCWGGNGNAAVSPNNAGQLFGSNIDTPYRRTDVANVEQVSVSAFNTCVLNAQGDVECWGMRDYPDNVARYTNVHDTEARQTPNGGHPEIEEMVQIDTGGRWHSCGIRDDGSVWCWGSNRSGMLGQVSGDIGTSYNFADSQVAETPPEEALVMEVTGLPGAASDIATGGEFACAEMEDDGSLWCWGKNYGLGEFGNPGPDPDPIEITEEFQCGTMNGQPIYCTNTETIDFTSSGPDGPTQAFNPDPHELSFWPRDNSVPHAFNFDAVSDVEPGTVVTSGEVEISGMADDSMTVGATVSGDGDPEMRVNGGSWTDAEVIVNGDVVQMRMTASNDFNTELASEMAFEGITSTFSVQTEAPPPPDELTVQTAMTTSEAEYDAYVAAGGVCTDAYSEGDEVNGSDFVNDPDVIQRDVNGDFAHGCVTGSSFTFGVFFNSATIAYVTF